MMNRNMLLNWINAGTISIPGRLIQEYRKLHLTEIEVMLLIQIFSFLEKGTSFPTPELLASRMSLSEGDCLRVIQSLMKRGFLELEECRDENGNISESFTLAPLWDKLFMLDYEQNLNKQVAEKEEDERTLYHLFESEFGRPLSPMECELITMWVDQENYNPAIIKAALMEGVVSGKRNLRYIDRILIEWNKNGVRTVSEAKEYGQKFRNHQYKTTPQSTTEPKKKFPSYNWLKE